jgi:hypothetical protein
VARLAHVLRRIRCPRNGGVSTARAAGMRLMRWQWRGLTPAAARRAGAEWRRRSEVPRWQRRSGHGRHLLLDPTVARSPAARRWNTERTEKKNGETGGEVGGRRLFLYGGLVERHEEEKGRGYWDLAPRGGENGLERERGPWAWWGTTRVAGGCWQHGCRVTWEGGGAEQRRGPLAAAGCGREC